LAASAISVVTFTGTPSAVAQPVATCTSDIIDGVEVDTCVGNPNALPVDHHPQQADRGQHAADRTQVDVGRHHRIVVLASHESELLTHVVIAVTIS
jgi:hypothetical protein